MVNRDKHKSIFLIVCWAFYDFANQFFVLNIVSLYFVRWLTLEKNTPEIFYSIAFGVSMFFVGLFAPVLGTISDITSRHKSFLVYLTLIAVIFTMLLSFTQSVLLALVIFAIANFGCQEAVVFYNALMVRVSPKDKIGLVSGLGRMFGYSGALLALYLTKPLVLARGYQATFLLTGVLFLVFALPCMIFIKDKPRKEKMQLSHSFSKESLLEVFNRLKATFSESSKFAGLQDFFKATFFGLCVVNMLILFMSVYATKVFGLDEMEVINFIGFCTLFAIGGSLFSGFISDLIGYKKTMMAVFFLWGVCLLGAALLKPPMHWFVGALAGISLGSTWVVSRALVVKLVPVEKVAEVFGLFNVIGYISAIIGPVYWGVILFYLSRFGALGYRIAISTLIVFMAVGFIFLLRVPEQKQKKEGAME